MVLANMKAFASLDLEWDSVEPIPLTWFDSAGTVEAERTAAAFLQNSFEHKKLFVLKDPRTSRTLPLWLRRISHHRSTPSVALIFRNPMEVAASLRARDGMGVQHALLLWLRYNLEAEFHSRDVPRAVVSYDALLSDWEGVANRIARAADIAWPANLHRARTSVEEFLDNAHRHHRVDDDKALARPEVMSLVRDAYIGLQLLSDEATHVQGRARMDKVRADLEAADSILGGALADLSVASRRSARALRVQAARLEDMRSELEASAGAERAAARALTAQQADVERLEAEARQATAALDLANAERSAVEERAKAAAADAEAAQAALAQANARVASEIALRDQAEVDADQAKARAGLQNILVRALLPQTRSVAARAARLEATAILRARQGGVRLGQPARIMRCALLGAFEFLRHPRLVLQLLRRPIIALRGARDRYRVRRSGLFDKHYYLAAYPDIREAGVDPLYHYVIQGWKEGRRPSAQFDVDLYHALTPGSASENPLLHLLRRSGDPAAIALEYAAVAAEVSAREDVERRLIDRTGLFDVSHYLATNPSVAKSGLDPIVHYLRHGWREGLSPGTEFDAKWYVAHYGDVARAEINPLLHYITYGAAEGRLPKPASRAVAAKSGGAGETPVSVIRSVSPAMSVDDEDVCMVCVPGDRPYVAGAKTVVLCAHVAGRALFGSERSLLDMADGLAACGFNIVITVPHGDQEYLSELRARSTFLRTFRYGWWRAGQPISVAVVNAFMKTLIECNADAIHVNTIMLREPLIAARRLGVPSVLHVRELITHDKALLSVLGETAEAVVEKVCGSADYIAANSHATAAVFAKQGATTVIPNVVDFDALNIPNLVNPDAINFAMISSNIAKKGLADFFKLAALCVEQAPKARFLLIGPDTSDLRELKDHYAGRMPRNLSFVDYLPTPRDAVAKANVIVNLSHFAESFGRTVLEGYAARRPAICYRWGALPELVSHDKTGFLVDFQDVEAVAKCVQELSEDPQLIMRMGEAGRGEAARRYGKSAYAEAMGRLYETVFSGNPVSVLETKASQVGDDPGLLNSVIARARDLPAASVRKPRLAYFCWHFPVPSETFILNELRILVAEGYDVKVFCRQIPHPNFKPDFPITWERVSTPAELARRLRETERDVAHGHFTYPVVTDFLWPACEEAGIQFTFTAHAQDIFRYANDEKNRIGEIVSADACRRVFVLSRFHHEYLTARGVPPGKIVINGNGVDPAAFADGAIANRSERSFKKICAVHRFSPKKGLDRLIRAAKLLQAEGIQVDIYGYGELETEYKALIAAEGVTNVQLLGAVETRAALVDVFRRYDLFVCPSVRAPDGDMDGIPTVLMEAMSAGLPVLATPVAGIPDLVQDGVTGLLCEGEPEAIAGAVRRFYAMPAARIETMITHARRHVEDNYDVRRLVNILQRVWRNDTIDLIIVSKDNPNELREIVRRLYAFTALPFHLVVCDNVSGPETLSFLEQMQAQKPNFTLIKNGYNAMVGPGTNRALDASSSDYAIYVCGKEGFALSPGWEIPFVHQLDARPDVGMVGSLGHSPTYLTGADYPKGVAAFASFRNKDFATRNADRVFKHIQGGLFAMRRKMYEQIGGFNQAVPHNLTDVEYSYYVESCGWKLGNARHILALFNKTRPGIEAHFDERVRAIHPPRLDDLGWLDQVAGGKAMCCNICAWRGPKFDGGDGDEVCPSCASSPSDRTLYRWLARSTLLHRRLPALGVNVPKPLEAVWRTHFQGPALSSDELISALQKKGRLENEAGRLQFGLLRNLPAGSAGRLMLSECARLLTSGAPLAIQAECERGELLEVACANGFVLSEEPLYRSMAARYDWRTLFVFTKAASIARHA